jgi:hypothetical protein
MFLNRLVRAAMKTILIILIIFASSVCFGEIYKWVDEKGTVHFTEDPTMIPDKYRDKAKSRTTEEDSMSIEERARAKQEHEKTVMDLQNREQRTYEQSLEEEKQRKEEKAREHAEYGEQINTEKEERARKLRETQKEAIPEYVKQMCVFCSGKGIRRCYMCDGTGWFGGVHGSHTTRCTSCGATGIIRCPDCNGKGYILKRIR